MKKLECNETEKWVILTNGLLFFCNTQPSSVSLSLSLYSVVAMTMKLQSFNTTKLAISASKRSVCSGELAQSSQVLFLYWLPFTEKKSCPVFVEMFIVV